MDNSQTSTEPYSCSECHETFSDPAQLKKHNLESHQSESNQTHRSDITEVELLLEDDSIFRKKNLIACELCPLAFTSNSKFNDHMLKHTGERTLKITFFKKYMLVSIQNLTSFRTLQMPSL